MTDVAATALIAVAFAGYAAFLARYLPRVRLSDPAGQWLVHLGGSLCALAGAALVSRAWPGVEGSPWWEATRLVILGAVAASGVTVHWLLPPRGQRAPSCVAEATLDELLEEFERRAGPSGPS